MLNFFKQLFKQYFVCKHLKYSVLRDIYCGHHFNTPVFMEKRKCQECSRKFYSDYFSTFRRKRVYFKKFNN